VEARRRATDGGDLVLADGGWKYLSAPFWEGEEIDEGVLWW